VELNAVLMEGDDAFRNGDLASARLLYRRVYDANDGRGALGIGASYDPVFLRRYHLWTRYANPEEARIWYRRAHDLGAQDAQNRLKRLNVKSAR
jgi:TPR repeat protein